MKWTTEFVTGGAFHSKMEANKVNSKKLRSEWS
ncbi:unnamed protein product, partial [marine sediment metagenome]